MDIKIKWLYRLGIILLTFILIYIFLLIRSIWLPLLQIVFTVLTPFVISAFISYLLYPTVEKLHKQGLHRGLSIFIIYVLFFGSVGYGIYKGVPLFVHQLKDFVENAPYFAHQYREIVHTLERETSALPAEIKARISEGIVMAELLLDRLLDKTVDILIKIGNSLFVIILIPFISFYMLKDIEKIKETFWKLTPYKWRNEGKQFLYDIDESLGHYIRGQFTVCLAMGLISFTLFWMIGLKYPLLLGIFVGVTNIIPYFGPIIGAIPSVIIAATMSIKLVIYSLIIILVLQFLEGNILSPYIVGKSLHMHPLLIIAALLAGGEIGGIIGLLIAVPLLAIVKVTLFHIKLRFIDKVRI
ncbi:predicted PurR-regulated permease PerM [Bacillus oleivorans]|uniref:Predicted PurR-regulated permease PerM n=1 Tax=Bacillus oleivorans TaxID=1448271 RepID=A0A285CXB7_9BACI|nr:AI-2E family transporter [Bacillus oleivorans]SNX71708.1 predicted PurR-regulated permease PerM [Bacillus oleivorans]